MIKLRGRWGDRRGQIAVEYILLLVVGVVIWLLIVSQLVSRNAESPGIVVKKWAEIIRFIGSDQIEKIED